MSWDNVLLDMLLWGAVIGGLLRWMLRREPDRPAPPSGVPSHVRPTRVEPHGRVLKIGVDVHARACVDDEGRVLCVCGLSDIDGEVVA